jgi:hypothetical protein
MESSLTDDAARIVLPHDRRGGQQVPAPATLRHPAQPDHQEQGFFICRRGSKRRRQKSTIGGAGPQLIASSLFAATAEVIGAREQ